MQVYQCGGSREWERCHESAAMETRFVINPVGLLGIMRIVVLVVLIASAWMPTRAAASQASPPVDSITNSASDRASSQATQSAQSELAKRTAAIRNGQTVSGSPTASRDIDHQWSRAVSESNRLGAAVTFGAREVALMLGICLLAFEVRGRLQRRRRRSR